MPTSLTYRRAQILLLVAILLGGFWLRLALYDYHGLEGDDGYSLSLARLDTGTLLHGLSTLELDIHPPLHFLALKGWIALAGESLLSLRLMNVLTDVLIGALMMRLAARAFTTRVAVAVGLLWLTAPLLLYGDYLIRMYLLLALFTAAGMVCIMEARHHAKPAFWYIAAAACGLLAGYTHIVGGLIAGTLALAVLVDGLHVRQHRGRTLISGAAAFGIAGILYAPYLNAVWSLYRSGRPLGAEISEGNFPDPFNALFQATATIMTHRALANSIAGLVLTLLLLAGSILLIRRFRSRALPLLIMTWLGLAGIAVLAWFAGFYKARYLMPFAPLVLSVAGGLLVLLKARWRAVAMLSLIIVSGWGILKDLDHSFRDDWVAATTFVQSHERPDDRVIVVPDWGATAFQFHYSGDAPVIGLFPHVSDDVPYAEVLADQTAGAARVWFVHYQPDISDPSQLVDQWFHSQAVTITDVFPSGMHIHYYDMEPQLAELPADARPLDASFGGTMRLRGVYMPVDHGSARDSRLHPPSNWVQVILYWEALQPQPDVILRVRLTDPYAQVYGAALERDSDLLHRMPPQAWTPGTIWETAYDLNLNPETPPGRYNVEVMVLDASTSEPLESTGTDAGDYWVIAGQFVVD